MRLIDADELLTAFPPNETVKTECVRATIEHMSTINPERKKGRWLELTNTNHTYVCSVCGRMLVNITDGKNMVSKNYPYCHCGADMRGEQGE